MRSNHPPLCLKQTSLFEPMSVQPVGLTRIFVTVLIIFSSIVSTLAVFFSVIATIHHTSVQHPSLPHQSTHRVEGAIFISFYPSVFLHYRTRLKSVRLWSMSILMSLSRNISKNQALFSVYKRKVLAALCVCVGFKAELWLFPNQADWTLRAGRLKEGNLLKCSLSLYISSPILTLQAAHQGTQEH